MKICCAAIKVALLILRGRAVLFKSVRGQAIATEKCAGDQLSNLGESYLKTRNIIILSSELFHLQAD